MNNFIMSFFEESLALITFFSIFCAGMVFTLFSLIFGGDADHSDVGDFDADHGDIDHDHDFGHGDLEHDDASASHGPSFFSIRGVSIMAVGFGGIAYIVQYLYGRVMLSSFAGLMSGWIFGLVGLGLINMFLKQQASSNIRISDIKSATGIVTTSIPIGKPGEVILNVAGAQMNKMAVAANGVAIPNGTRVRVVEHHGASVLVEVVN